MELNGRLRALATATTLLVVCTSCGRNRPYPLAKSAKLEVFVVAASGAAGMQTVVDPSAGTPIRLVLPPIITSADVATIQRSEDSPKYPSFTVNVTPTGAAKLRAATTPAAGQLAVLVNGKVASVAKVFSTLSDSFVISGSSIAKDREEIFAALTEE